MDNVYIVIFQKNKETGFLDKELLAINISENENLITNIFVESNEDKLFAHMKITTDRDLEDWEYSAVFDYYDTKVFDAEIIEITEIEDNFNPMWELVFEFVDDESFIEEKVSKILSIHKKELDEIYLAIKEKKDDYI